MFLKDYRGDQDGRDNVNVWARKLSSEGKLLTFGGGFGLKEKKRSKIEADAGSSRMFVFGERGCEYESKRNAHVKAHIKRMFMIST